MRMLCLGSLNVDHVYAMEHFVKAGETIAALELRDYCGGKGLNQSIALSKAGCPTYHAGMIGSDGVQLIDMLKQSSVNTSFIKTVDAPTGHAIIQVEKTGQNCIIIFGGANDCIDEAYIDEVYSHFERGDTVLLQNEISNLPYAIRRAHELGLLIALNPSPMTKKLVECSELQFVTWFILNEIEGESLSGAKEPQEICEKLRVKFPDAAILLTLGEKGCLYCDGNQRFEQGIYRVSVVDTTAAGDTFTGYFLAGISEGMPIPEVLNLASKASAITVSSKGAAASIPLRRDVEEMKL